MEHHDNWRRPSLGQAKPKHAKPRDDDEGDYYEPITRNAEIQADEGFQDNNNDDDDLLPARFAVLSVSLSLRLPLSLSLTISPCSGNLTTKACVLLCNYQPQPILQTTSTSACN